MRHTTICKFDNCTQQLTTFCSAECNLAQYHLLTERLKQIQQNAGQCGCSNKRQGSETKTVAHENQQNAQMIYIFSICSTYMFRSCLTIIRVRCYKVIQCRVSTRPPHSAHTSTQDILNIYTQLFKTWILIINTPHDVWIVKNINNYTLYECTYQCITYSVSAHPDDAQARPKHVGAKNWENIYHLCILLAFISNYTTMHGVEHIKLETKFQSGKLHRLEDLDEVEYS